MYKEMSKEFTDSFRPLFEEAEEKGLWFFTEYQQLWISPSKLREAHKNGQFRWDAINWKLRDPMERVKQLKQEAIEATQNAGYILSQIR